MLSLLGGSMDEKNELARRFKSIRMVLRGIKSYIILQAVLRNSNLTALSVKWLEPI